MFIYINSFSKRFSDSFVQNYILEILSHLHTVSEIMDDIGYAVEADFIERAELTLKPGILVLTGLNSTFKSIAARTFLVANVDEAIIYKLNFSTLGVKISFTEQHEKIVSNALRKIVSDSRIVTRFMLSLRSELLSLFEIAEKIGKNYPDAPNIVKRVIGDLGLGFY